MSTSTVYDVKIQYSLDDKASAGLAGLGSAAQKTGGALDGLKASFGAVAVAAASAFSFAKMKSAFIDFNADIEQSKIQIATISKMFGQAGDFDTAMQQAEDTFGRYQEAAKASTATTKEFLEMHQMLAPQFAASGIAGEKLEKIVKAATVAAPTFNLAPDVFARDLESMLAGNVKTVDRGARLLLKSLGLDHETFNKKAKNNADFAIKTIEQGLGKLSGSGALQKMEGSFKGVVSTLEDTLQILAGQAGKGVFELITKEIQSWNDWLVKNKDEVEHIKKVISENLVAGFHAIKTAIQWVVDHSSELRMIGEIFIALKGASMVGGALNGGFQTVTTALTSLGSAATAATGGGAAGLIGMASGLGNVVAGLGILYTVLQAAADYVDKFQKTRVEEKGTRDALITGLRTSKTAESADSIAHLYAKEFNAITEKGELNKSRFVSGMSGLGISAADQSNLLNIAIAAWKVRGEDPYEKAKKAGLVPDFRQTQDATAPKVARKADVNVTIHKIEVASDDPDRFAFGMEKSFQKIASNPTQAKDLLRR